MGQCGSALRKPCLGATDVRYDANIPKDSIVAQDQRWEKFQGYFLYQNFRFDSGEGNMAQPSPYNRPGSEARPFVRANGTAWYNHTFDGSRLYIHRHYLSSPAPQSFCEIPFFPQGGTNHSPGGECGVTGFSQVAGQLLALTHENDGSLEQIRSYGGYGGGRTRTNQNGDRETKLFLVDENTIDGTSVSPTWSSATSYVFFDNDTAVVSAINTMVERRQIVTTATGKMTRVTEQEYIDGLAASYDEFNVPQVDRAVVPLTNNEAVPGTYPNETEWCGGLINDTSCTESPYVEPDPQFTEGAIAMFVIIAALVFGIIAYSIHWYFWEKQKKRIQFRMVRGIAQNVTIAESAGQMDGDMLLKEFNHIANDKGGTIRKEEMKQWMADGKLGTISDKDFNAMWTAMDIDQSGEVDFIEFATYLSGCGEAFDEVFKERQNMSKADRLKRLSQRLSVKVQQLSKDDIEALRKLKFDEDASVPF